jgi:hypothetical protein
MYGSDLGFIFHIHELRKRSGREFKECISADCMLCSNVSVNSSIDYFFVDKLNMVIDVPEYGDFEAKRYE